MKTPNLITGLLISVLIGFAVYLCIYGLKATALLAWVPYLGTIIANLNASQVILVALFGALFYFAANYLSRMAVVLCTAVFLFVLIYWGCALLPEVWNGMTQFWSQVTSI